MSPKSDPLKTLAEQLRQRQKTMKLKSIVAQLREMHRTCAHPDVGSIDVGWVWRSTELEPGELVLGSLGNDGTTNISCVRIPGNGLPFDAVEAATRLIADYSQMNFDAIARLRLMELRP